MTPDDPCVDIARNVAPGARLVRHWPLEGGVSAQVEALEIALPDGQIERIVVRRHGMTDRKPPETEVTATEFALLRALHEAGFTVPEPRLLDTSGAILPSPYMVMAFVDGSTELSPGVLPEALRSMTAFLASLHQLDLATLALPALPRRDDLLPETERYAASAAQGERVLAAIATHGAVGSPNAPVLLHGDYWPGNILWRAGEMVAVLDWEDAAIGDPVADLASTRLELLWKYGRNAMETFTRLYLSERPIDLATMPFWEVAAASGASALMSEWGLDTDTEADMRAKAVWLIDDALRRITADE